MSADPIEMHGVGPASAALLAALHSASFAGSPAEPWSAESVCSLLQSPGMLAFIATLPAADTSGEPQPCGLAVARCGPDDAEILALGVLPKLRRRGIATCLLAELERHFATTGIRKILLEVAVDNHPARTLYATQGFSEVGLRRGYYRRRAGPPTDALVLARPVAGPECIGPGPAPLGRT